MSLATSRSPALRASKKATSAPLSLMALALVSSESRQLCSPSFAGTGSGRRRDGRSEVSNYRPRREQQTLQLLALLPSVSASPSIRLRRGHRPKTSNNTLSIAFEKSEITTLPVVAG